MFLSESLIRSFLVSEMGNSLTSLISSERPDWFAHGCSFILSDLSEMLTVAHLIWAKWATERMSDWANEQWANELIPSPVWKSAGVYSI